MKSKLAQVQDNTRLLDVIVGRDEVSGGSSGTDGEGVVCFWHKCGGGTGSPLCSFLLSPRIFTSRDFLHTGDHVQTLPATFLHFRLFMQRVPCPVRVGSIKTIDNVPRLSAPSPVTWSPIRLLGHSSDGKGVCLPV